MNEVRPCSATPRSRYSRTSRPAASSSERTLWSWVSTSRRSLVDVCGQAVGPGVAEVDERHERAADDGGQQRRAEAVDAPLGAGPQDVVVDGGR